MKKSFNLFLILVSAICTISCSESNNDNEKENEPGTTCTQNYCDGNTAVSCANGSITGKVDCVLGCNNGICNTAPQQGCIDGQLGCNDGIPQKCVGTVWVAQPACLTGQHCADGICVNNETPVCEENKLQCSIAGVPQKCLNNAWVDQDACTEGKLCYEGVCTDNGITVCTENKLQCSKDGIPQKCENNAWVDQNACTDTETCIDGVCKPNTDVQDDLCKNVKCGTKETCTRGVCVPTAMLNAKEGAACDNDWYAEYCNEDGNAVYCMEDAKGNLKLYVEKCDANCKVGYTDEEDDGETWRNYFAVCIDEEIVSQCKEPEMNLVYCADFEDGSYMSAYECVNAIGGGFSVIDGLAYGVAVECKDVCDTNGVECEGMCDDDSSCSANAPYCESYYCEECVYGNENKKCKDASAVCTPYNTCEEAGASECKPEKCVAAEDEHYTGNVCVDIMGYIECGCNTKADCRDGFTCNETYNICLEEVVGAECTKDSDCSGETPYCDTEYGICAECIVEDTERVCKDTTKTCLVDEKTTLYYCGTLEVDNSCQNDSDCSGSTPRCDEVYEECVECLEDSDCSGDKPYCDPGYLTCVECILNKPDKACKDTNKTCMSDPQTLKYYCGVSEQPTCQKDAVKCEDDYVMTCDGSKWVKAAEACKNGCDKGACVVVEEPTSITIALSDYKSQITTLDSYDATNTITLKDNVTITLKGNYASADNTFHMNQTSSLVVSGLKSLSKITISYKNSGKANNFTVSAGTFTTIESVAKDSSDTVNYEVTDKAAKSFTISDEQKKALSIVSIGWEY